MLWLFQSAFQNAKLPADVDESGDATPLDALIIINSLNLNGSECSIWYKEKAKSPITCMSMSTEMNCISPVDALLVINALNKRQFVSSEGEEAQHSEAFRPSIDAQLAFDIIAGEVASLKGRKILAR